MLVLIGLLGLMLSIVSTTLVALFRTDRQIRRDLEQVTSLARLSDQFRADAHAATSCTTGPACTLQRADGRTVHYAFVPPAISREVRREQAVEHRDTFRLPDTAVVRFDMAEDVSPRQSGRLVRLTIAAAASSDKPYLTAVRPATIEAAIGLSPASSEASAGEAQP
ncbi:MAG: hypothetical protein WD872_17030 [Pirellulaceae bacterium]